MDLGLARSCARICVRLKGFLLLHRDGANFVPEGRFPLVKWSLFEMASDVLKSMISQS
jgi:hypothetical protein